LLLALIERFINLLSALHYLKLFTAIQPGIICVVLQSAAQYFWYAVKGHRYDEEAKQDTNGWDLPFSPFW